MIVVRSRLLTRLGAALIVTLAAASGYAQEFDPLGAPPTDFRGGIDGPNGTYYEGLDEYKSAPRCLAHEMSMPGQGVYISGSGVYISGSGVYISGSVRGLVLGTQVTVEGTPVGTVTEPAFEPGLLVQSSLTAGIENYAALLAAPPLPGSTVGILVVDDFAGGHFDLPSKLWQAGLDEATLEAWYATGKLSHGAIVLAHLRALIEGTGNYVNEVAEPTWLQWHHLTDDSSHVVVIPIDTSQKSSDGSLIPIDTIKVRAAIVDAVATFKDRLANLGQSVGLVVNMSWVLLPCPTVADFMSGNWHFDTFADYVMGLEIDKGLAPPAGSDDLAWRLSLLRWVPPGDPLASLFGAATGAVEPPLDASVVLVAAAGNFDGRYQMLPAALPNVLGVGTPALGQPQPAFSNDGDVAARGAWFHLDGIFSYAGTSYSAPLLSLFAAVDLASQAGCVPSVSAPARPGFGIDKSIPGYQGLRVPLQDAASYCNLP